MSIPHAPAAGKPGVGAETPPPEASPVIFGNADIPLDPTMDLPPAEAARVRAELAERVRAAGANWRPVVEQHLRAYGAWVDPAELERRRAEDDRRQAEAERRRARARRLDDGRPATRGDLERLEDDAARVIAAVRDEFRAEIARLKRLLAGRKGGR
jgi:hypothetical protein